MRIQCVENQSQKVFGQMTYGAGKQRFVPSFCAAKDLNLRYILDKYSHELPVRVLERAKNICRSSKGERPTLFELHLETYADLIKARSLEEAVAAFPEFKKVLDLKDLPPFRSKAAGAVKSLVPDSEYTLDLLKLLYAPMRLDDIAKFYGVKARSDLTLFLDKLNIPRLTGAYLRLFKLSNPIENKLFAEKSQRVLKTPEAIKKCNEKAAAAHRTPEYRAKKRQEMIDFYKRNPDAAEKVRMISQATWDRCPEIKAAMITYTAEQPTYVRSALAKRSKGGRLTPTEKRTVASYYKNFWDTHPSLKELYSERKREVVEELKKR